MTYEIRICTRNHKAESLKMEALRPLIQKREEIQQVELNGEKYLEK